MLPDRTAVNGPVAFRMQLGARLRRLRKDAGVTREAAGWEIRGSESKISRIELGRVPVKERDVADLLALYRADARERAALLALVRRANAAGWWQRYADIVPSWFLSYLGMEEAASQIRTYELQFVPGLLQTVDYARAVIRLGHANASPAEVERRIQLRQGRQRILRRARPPLVWAVIDEAVLRRRIGGTEVMHAQLRALADAAQRPNVRLQIIPFRAGVHAATGCPFAVLRFPEPELSDVVYVEQLTSALYLDRPGDVDDYAWAMERACMEAEPPDRSVRIVERLLHDPVDAEH